MTRPTRHASAAVLALAALIGAAVAQPPQHPTLGHAAYAAGYTRALYIESDDSRRTRPFNPNAVLDADRYGGAATAGRGNTVGERANCTIANRALAAGYLPGFVGPLDEDTCPNPERQDLKLLTRNGQTALFDDMAKFLGLGVMPTPTPRPSPTPVATPTPTPVHCPCDTILSSNPPIICPPCSPPPPVCEACPVYERATLPPEVVEGLAMLTNLKGPMTLWKAGRRATVERMRQALEGWDVWRSTGQIEGPCLDEPPGSCGVAP